MPERSIFDDIREHREKARLPKSKKQQKASWYKQPINPIILWIIGVACMFTVPILAWVFIPIAIYATVKWRKSKKDDLDA